MACSYTRIALKGRIEGRTLPAKRLHLVILPGEGFIVENRGGGAQFLIAMARKGWLGRVTSVNGAGFYLEGMGRLAAFTAYVETQGFSVTTSL